MARADFAHELVELGGGVQDSRSLTLAVRGAGALRRVGALRESTYGSVGHLSVSGNPQCLGRDLSGCAQQDKAQIHPLRKRSKKPTKRQQLGVMLDLVALVALWHELIVVGVRANPEP